MAFFAKGTNVEFTPQPNMTGTLLSKSLFNSDLRVDEKIEWSTNCDFSDFKNLYSAFESGVRRSDKFKTLAYSIDTASITFMI